MRMEEGPERDLKVFIRLISQEGREEPGSQAAGSLEPEKTRNEFSSRPFGWGTACRHLNLGLDLCCQVTKLGVTCHCSTRKLIPRSQGAPLESWQQLCSVQ